MQKDQCEALAQRVREGLEGTHFDIEEQLDAPLSGFHQFADGLTGFGAFLIANESVKYWLVFSRWKEEIPNYYLIVFPEDKSNPICEIHRVEGDSLIWNYKPTKQDGKNPERKLRFNTLAEAKGIQLKSDFEVKLFIPHDQDQSALSRFLGDVFKLADIRIRADDISISLPAEDPASKYSPTTNLNTILYGPPGTGKTYATARRCVEICDGERTDEKPPEEIRTRYMQLMDQGRVEFVTFHQSYGYEEFIEGLRPTTKSSDTDDGGQAGFRLTVRDGVLKRLAITARGPSSSTDQTQGTSSRSFFKVGLGNPQKEPEIFDRCISESCIRLGWGSEVNWSSSKFRTREAIFKHWKATINGTVTNRSKPPHFVHLLRNEMRQGDIIVVPNGVDRFKAVGEVTGEYVFDEESDGYFANCRDVRWHWIAEGNGEEVSAFQEQQLVSPTIHRLNPTQPEFLLSFLNADDAGQSLPHVLIIDEINRANVSKVMGELITLLEEDKREGADNEVAVTLPYSDDSFTLPANLHILGTMNTADRSIALIDTALRRRFQFEEMAPRPKLLRDAKNATGIDLPKVLRALNRRLEYLIDRDHLIGHAWLMGAKTKDDVDDVMRHKIIPLIAEYFYDDWAKVRAVLGGTDDFVRGQPLNPPPGLPDETGEERHRWIIRKKFEKNAYACLIAGKRVEDEGATDESS